jgi:hypothetical protein
MDRRFWQATDCAASPRRILFDSAAEYGDNRAMYKMRSASTTMQTTTMPQGGLPYGRMR